MGKLIYHLLLIAFLGLIVYSHTFDVPFTFDDIGEIKENSHIRNLDNFALSLRDFIFSSGRYFGYLTFALNYHFGGLNVPGYHAVNLTIHLTNAILVYFLVRLTFKTPFFVPQRKGTTKKREKKNGTITPRKTPSLLIDKKVERIALFSALLFVSHPIQTQAVTYIVQRFSSLATLLYLLSLVFYIKGRLAGQGTRDKEQRSTVKRKEYWTLALTANYFGLSLIFSVLAMKTKETTFTLPLAIILYEFFFFKASWKKKPFFLLPIMLTLIIIPLSIIDLDKPLGEILSGLNTRTRVETNISRWDYLITQIRVITTYVRLLFLPVNQNLDYDYPIYYTLLAPSVFLSFLFVLSLFSSAVLLYSRSRMQINTSASSTHTLSPPAHRLISFGILWFFITLSVESSIIPIADVIFEHRVYLPSIGVFIAITASIFTITDKLKSRWQGTDKAAMPALFVIIVILAGATYARNVVWQDEARLWHDVVKKSPEKARGYNDLGYIYLKRGLIDKAIDHFQIALSLNPYNANAHNNLAVAYYNKGLIDKAISHFQITLMLSKLKRDLVGAHHNLGIAYSKKGLLDDALRELEAASKLDSNNAEIYNDIGVTYKQKGLIDKAIKNYLTALKLKPDYAMAHLNLGIAYEFKGWNDKAEEHFSRAHRLTPKKY